MTTRAARSSAPPPTQPRRWFGLLAVLTALIWAGRLRNLASADGAGWRELTPAVGFVALAVLAAVIAVRVHRRGRVLVWDRYVGAAVALATTIWWAVRGIEIALDDHRAGFVLIHSVLALTSIFVAVMAARSLQLMRWGQLEFGE